ncbi:MAG TPA: hypothetical protein VNW04_10845 [Puia sp.]|nr:hypothetical protein [Puia sp.]
MLPEALSYQLKVRDHFKQQTATWEFFAATRTREEQLVSFQTELLKNTYQFQRETDAGLYAQIDLALERLGLGPIPVTAYQAQYTNEVEGNASIVYLHQEAHLVFSGPIRQRLNETELLAVIAHQLTHIHLSTLLAGELEVAGRIITAIGNDHQSSASYFETARLFRLYTEIYCDRGAFAVVGYSDAIITGLEKAAGNVIRTQAIRLWQDQREAAEPAITKMVEGPADLDRLDLFTQASLHSLTLELVLDLLWPEWARTPAVLGLVHQYFPALSWNGTAETGVGEKLGTILATAQSNIREYFSYLLLDFALADPSLENQLLGRAIAFAEEAGLSGVFEPVCKRELQFGDKKWQQRKQLALAAYQDIQFA